MPATDLKVAVDGQLRVMKHLLRERGVTEQTWDLEALGLTVPRDERRS